MLRRTDFYDLVKPVKISSLAVMRVKGCCIEAGDRTMRVRISFHGPLSAVEQR